MTGYLLPQPTGRRPSRLSHTVFAALFVTLAATGSALAGWWFWPRREPLPEPAVSPPVEGAARRPPAFRQMVFPTDQDLLGGRTRPGTFMPTSPERPESALFGSVRTAASRSGEVASFHEGVDIAPVRRDRRGNPLDEVRAVAEGTVAYVNRSSGSSSYGCYVVLLHDDPVGQVFSLYAHLASVNRGVAAGTPVTAGTPLGTMGHTANYRFPLARAHLHLEMGLVNNSRFRQWFRQQKLKPDHGTYNGWNLLGVDPLGVFAAQRQSRSFSFREFLDSAPAAFELIVRTRRRPDFFDRYPTLWSGAAFTGDAVVLRCSENGLPLGGRNATPAEAVRCGAATAAVLSVNEAALGRNGARLIGRSGGGWAPASGSKRWLDILTY